MSSRRLARTGRTATSSREPGSRANAGAQRGLLAAPERAPLERDIDPDSQDVVQSAVDLELIGAYHRSPSLLPGTAIPTWSVSGASRDTPTPHPVLRLQQQVGNARVARALVGKTGEDAPLPTWFQPEVGLQGGAVSNRLAGRIYESLGHGARLDPAWRTELEDEFGVSLDKVRLHMDDEARELSLHLSAQAFTLGNDIYFGHGASPTDTRLLRHEIAHVAQQQNASPPTGPLTVGPADDPLERAAEATAIDRRPQTAETGSEVGVQRDFWDELNVGNIAGILGTGGSVGQGLAETANLPLANMMGVSAPSITNIPGMSALGGVTSAAGLITGTRDVLDEDKPWYERVVGGMSAFGGATGLASTISGMFGSSLFAAGGSAGLTAGAGTALTGGGAGLATGAGAATALGSLGAVLGAGAAGYGAGRLLDEGVGALGRAITGDEQGDYTISGGLASGMTAIDQALTPLWADPDRPAYTQTLGWKLGEWLGI